MRGQHMAVVEGTVVFIGNQKECPHSAIFGVGINDRMRLGIRKNYKSSAPTLIMDPENIRDFAYDHHVDFSKSSVSLTFDETYLCVGGYLFVVSVMFPRGILRIFPSKNTVVMSVSCGMYHTFVISEECVLLCKGSNFRGQLGLGSMINQQKEFVEIFDVGLVTKVSCGAYFTYITNQDGCLYVAGENTYFQTGNPHYPFNVALEFEKMSQETSEDHSFYCNMSVTMNDKMIKEEEYPPEISLGFYDLCKFQKVAYACFSPYQIIQVSCGKNRILFLTKQGEVYDIMHASLYPILPKKIPIIDKVVKVSASGKSGYSIFLHENSGFTISEPRLKNFLSDPEELSTIQQKETKQSYTKTKTRMVDVSQGFSAYLFLLTDDKGYRYTWYCINGTLCSHPEYPILLPVNEEANLKKSARN